MAALSRKVLQPARPRRVAPGAPWRIELHLERGAWPTYLYRHVVVERTAKRAQVRELRLALAYDEDLVLTTPPREVLRARGRTLSDEEADRLWRRVRALRPERLPGSFLCLDHLDPRRLDPTVGLDGEPISVSTGEEGPACLTLRWGPDRRQKRIVVARFRDPPAEVCPAPLTRLVQALDELLGAAPLRARRVKAGLELAREFEHLRGLAFLNLRQVERRAIEALGALGGAEAVPSLTQELFAQDAQVRLQALDALAAIGDGSAMAEVELLADSDETHVREKARRVLELLRSR
jgi:hypothetical protein